MSSAALISKIGKFGFCAVVGYLGIKTVYK